MFTQSFHLNAHPFEEQINPQNLIKDERVVPALERLDYFVNHGQAALLTGPSGVGKTLLLSHLLETLPAHRFQAVIPPISSVESPAMFRMIVSALGEKPSLGKDRLFRQIIQKTQASGRTTLIILDDAHLLSEKTLIDLRLLLSTPAAPTSPTPIKLLLSGQPHLSKQLTSSSLADLLNRISVRSSLHALTPTQTIHYINHRLSTSDGQESLFDEPAKALIHAHTGGIPRGINNLATTCLIHAASKGIQTISETQVIEAAGELRLI